MTSQDLKKILESRTSLTVERLAEEAGITRPYLNMIMSGDRPMTESVSKKIKPVINQHLKDLLHEFGIQVHFSDLSTERRGEIIEKATEIMVLLNKDDD